MCVPEAKIVALVGASGAGKTTLARRIAEISGLALRSCGNETVRLATARQEPVAAISDDVHRQLDRETLSWVASSELGLVEGRFLDVVLAPVENRINLIRVTAAPLQRRERLASIGRGLSTPENRDRADQEFRQKFYSGVRPIVPAYTIDTSSDTVEMCVNELMAFLEIPRRAHS